MLKDILSNKGNYIKDHNIDWFMAKISHKNIPSQKLFKKAGFDIDIEGNEVLAFKNTQKEFGR